MQSPKAEKYWIAYIKLLMNLTLQKQSVLSLGWMLGCCLLATTGQSQSSAETLTIRNVESINTKTLEYAPLIYGDQLIFTSTRPTVGSPMTRWRDEKEQFSDLYVADKGEAFRNIRRLPGKASSPVHDGVATFNKSGTEMFFTRSNKNGKNEKNIINLKIYSAQLVNNIWQNIQELPINDEEFSNCHPSLSPDGKALIFASNRPGGFGGMDLYRSKNVDGVWQSPENLGPTINSASNELFPFISAKGQLYFASDKEQSIGGLDIFKSVKNEGTDQYTDALNLGVDFNSTADDFGFCESEDEREGYFTSNRVGGKGGDDIYHWKWTAVELPPHQLTFSVQDVHRKEPVAHAQVTIFDGAVQTTAYDVFPIAKMGELKAVDTSNPYYTLEQKQYQTGSKGDVSLIVDHQKSYTVFIEKEGYLPAKKVLTSQALLEQQRIEFELQRRAGIPLKIHAVTMPFRVATANVSLHLWNKCIQKIERAVSNLNGDFTFFLACGCDYELVGEKDGFRQYKKQFSTKYRDCGDLRAINTKIYLIEKQVMADIAQSDQERFLSLAHYEEAGKGKVGEIALLDRIIFAENKADLLPETINALYEIHYFLQRRTNMSVEISVHTDARGTAKLNHRLAQRRADAILEFLLQKGIPKEQISVVGYGEDKLLNHCGDGVRCSEAEHLQNKRVELKIIKIDRPRAIEPLTVSNKQ
ncbi:MAG: OmpA family protein [Bacteroidota bacterium]